MFNHASFLFPNACAPTERRRLHNGVGVFLLYSYAARWLFEHQSGACGERHVRRDGHGIAGNHVAESVAGTHNFGISAHVNIGERLIGAVHQHDEAAVAVGALIDVELVGRHKMTQCACRHGFVALAPMEQTAHEVERVALERRASVGGKHRHAVAWESAWHVEAHIAVGHSLAAVHQHFCAIVYLRNAAGGQKECLRLFPAGKVRRLI